MVQQYLIKGSQMLLVIASYYCISAYVGSVEFNARFQLL